MATATATISMTAFPDGKDLTFNHFHVYGRVAISAGNYPAAGFPLNWGLPENQSELAPSFVEFMSIGSPPGLYDYVWDGNNLRILQQSVSAATGTAPFSEFPTGAGIPTAIVNDVIQVHAIFRRA